MKVSAMPFSYTTEVVSKRQFDEHIALYRAYADKVNDIDRQLREERNLPGGADRYRGLKKEETYAIDGVILHELYFQNLVKDNQPPGRRTNFLLAHHFGGVEAWTADFAACARAARGWCVCVYEQRTETCRNIMLDSHDAGMVCTAYPLVVLDMYEHAYFMDCGADKAAYVESFMKHIPWGVIEKRAGAVAR